MKKIFLTLIMVALLSSCSSIDPDVDFKGKVDDDFMMTLSRGEIPMSLQFDLNNSYSFKRPYKNGKAYGKWVGLLSGDWVGFSFGGPDLYIFNGSSWIGYDCAPDDYTRPELELEIGYAWFDYVHLTGYDKKQLIRCTFDYDLQNRKVLIDGNLYNVESATGNKMVLSYEGFMYGSSDGKLEIADVMKDIYAYNKIALPFSPEDVDTYENYIEAMLAHISIMRAYKGDVWHLSSGREIKLAKIEELILAGKLHVEDLTEEEIEEIFGPSN